MVPLLTALLAGAGFLVAYHTYGRWLGGKIFALSAKAVCPSYRLEDGVDYVPTSRGIVFGHHFTSIAGTGPIVGPAIAIMWGWLPALLWVFFGSIFIGAVHDFGALVVSLRNNGQTVGDIAGRVLNRRARWIFLLILALSLTIVLAIFGLVIASVFRLYPAAIFPCVVQIPLAVGIGVWLRRKGASIFLPALFALAAMYLAVFFGDSGFLGEFNRELASWSNWTWVLVLLFYSYAASVLPVWTLLQPRDYINSLQLISALGLIVLGLAVAAFWGGSPLAEGVRPDLQMAAPAVNWTPEGALAIFPFLFITIACGAVSGFHCLVSSGTSSKQLKREPDARFVGYGGMLAEGFLASLVILACGAGLGLGLTAEGRVLVGEEAWENRYGSWGSAGSLSAKVSAFVFGAANFLRALGLSGEASIALMGVLVASFAGTTLDTACRLQRYVVQELAAASMRSKVSGAGRVGGAFAWLRNKHGAALFAVAAAAGMAGMPPAGQEWSLANAGEGGLLLWPLFGATNQLLAGGAFLVIAFYLWRRRRPVWFLAFPMVFMLIMPLWAMVWQLFIGSDDHPSWMSQGKVLLSVVGLSTIVLELWMIVEAVRLFPKVKGVFQEDSDFLRSGRSSGASLRLSEGEAADRAES